MTRIAQLFEGDEVAPAEAYAEPLAELRRAFRAFSAVRRAVLGRDASEIDARLAALLRAVHASAPAGVRLAEGSTLAVRVAAGAPGGEVEALLLGDDDAAKRYGGPDVAGLLRLARAVAEAGGQVERVLSGLSRRERESQPALAAMDGDPGGLWRLLVSASGRRGEAWWLSELTPEGSAAVPLLLLDERPRVVLSSDGAHGAAWSDGATAALAEAFASWPAGDAAEAADEEGA